MILRAAGVQDSMGPHSLYWMPSARESSPFKAGRPLQSCFPEQVSSTVPKSSHEYGVYMTVSKNRASFFVSVFELRARLFGVYIGAADFWKLPRGPGRGSHALILGLMCMLHTSLRTM